MDTTNILFICGGTFVGLEDIIAKRVGKKSFGFGSSGSKSDMTKAELLMQVTADDLIDFGMIPEFVGRLPILAPLEPLTEDAMVDILTQPRNALVKQYRKLFDMEGAEIEFEDAALREIARGPLPAKPGPAVCDRSWKTSCWICSLTFPNRKKRAAMSSPKRWLKG